MKAGPQIVQMNQEKALRTYSELRERRNSVVQMPRRYPAGFNWLCMQQEANIDEPIPMDFN